MPKVENLTDKQSLFVREYIIDFNASRAALQAKYSKKTAPFIGAENLKKPQIQKAIKKALEYRARKLRITQEDTLSMVKDIADIDHADYGTKRTSKGIEMLCRCQGLFIDKHELTGKNGGPIQTQALMDLAGLRKAMQKTKPKEPI